MTIRKIVFVLMILLSSHVRSTVGFVSDIPNDPQFYFCEGWAYEMQGNSLNHALHTPRL